MEGVGFQKDFFSQVASTKVLPANFLNAYEVLNASKMVWTANLYKVQRLDNRSQIHEERGDIKSTMFDLRRKHSNKCKGYGFVIDVSPDQVVVPESWAIPNENDVNGFKVFLEKKITVSLTTNDALAQKAAIGILREGIKAFFKNNRYGSEFGNLWQDAKYFCEKPEKSEESEYYICRRFYPTVKILQANQVVVQCNISTAMFDNKTFDKYFLRGEAKVLASYISAKRLDKVDRQNQPIGVRVLHVIKSGGDTSITSMELENPDEFVKYAQFSIEQQKEFAKKSVFCRAFMKEPEAIPLSELVLVLDSQITQEDHSETIMDPADRYNYTKRLRNFINSAEIYGFNLELSATPFNTDLLKGETIKPPAILLKGGGNKFEIIRQIKDLNESALKERVKSRMNIIRKNGFLEQRPINPLLAYPRYMTKEGAERMKVTLNKILKDQGIKYSFSSYFLFDKVSEIKRTVENGGYDTLLAVLPMPSGGKNEPDFHEQIKTTIEVPSQCIQATNTLNKKWFNLPLKEFERKERKLANRIGQRYELCIWNLLVKHHWIPFVPADSFNYNVQVGLDVGGKHNNRVLSCLGYGFKNPQELLIFRPDEIPINASKAEPIPVNDLYKGLDGQFSLVGEELLESNITPNFETTLFYRDGKLLGDGDRWNEKNALVDLHKKMLTANTISDKSIWTAVEVIKYADGWRIFNSLPKIENPLAGYYVQLFDDDSTFLVCTTGRQYLTQGTACPLLVKIVDIYGKANRHDVIRDLVWQTDMCFTKTDTGMKLPWVLNVADSGALQLSRSYKISGITA